MTGVAVAAAANGELARELDDARNVGGVLSPDDDRWPTVDPAGKTVRASS